MAHIDLSAIDNRIPVYANVAALPVIATSGDVAVTLSPLDLYIYNGSAWEALTANGFLNGVVAPTTEGQDGDFYLDTVTKYLYLKASGTWTQVGSVQLGHILSGAAAPTTEGQNGDQYIDTVTKYLYLKASGTWTQVGTVQYGHVLSGIIAPTTEGQDGDFYTDTVTGYLYSKVAGVWSQIGTVQYGHTLQASGVPAGGLGAINDTYYNTATGIFYVKTGASTWTAVTPDATGSVRGLVSTGSQTFAGDKTFNNNVIVTGYATSSINTDSLEATGFVSNDTVNISYNETSREITIATGTSYYIKGVKYTLSSPLVLDHPDVDDTYLFYINTSNTFTVQNSVWDFSVVQVAEVIYRSALTPKAIVLRETHGFMDWRVHEELHRVVGTYKQSGGAVSGYVKSVATPLNTYVPIDADNTFGVDSAVIHDEDIEFTTAQRTDGSTFRIVYKSGSSWVWSAASATPFLMGTTYPQFNQISGGSGSLVEITAPTISQGRWVNYYVALCQTLDTEFNVIVIPGQAQHNRLTSAQAENTANLDLAGLPFEEFVFIQKFTFRAYPNWANTGRVRIEDDPIIIGTKLSQVSVSGAVSPTNHSNLSNRSDTASHPTTAIETTTTNFNGGLSTAETDVQLAFDRLDDFGFCGAWTTATAYRIGNIVSYNGELWRCTTANSDVAFTVGNWANLVNRYISDSVNDGASVTKTTTSSSMILLAISYGDVGLLVSATKNSAIVNAVTDPDGVFLSADSGTGIYVSKSAGSANISIKNRTGGAITLITRFLTNVI